MPLSIDDAVGELRAGPGGSSMLSSACGSSSRRSWRAVRRRSASSGCSAPLHARCRRRRRASSTFGVAVGAAALDDEQVGRARAAAGRPPAARERRARSRLTRPPAARRRPRAGSAGWRGRRRAALDAARATPVVSTAAAHAQMRQSGSSAAVVAQRDERAGERLAARLGQRRRLLGPQRAREQPLVEQRIERLERGEPERRLALRGGRRRAARGRCRGGRGAGGEDHGDHVLRIV